MKRLSFIVFIFIPLILIGCLGESETKFLKSERESIEQKAISVSKATYSGDVDYLKKISEDKNHEYFKELVELNKGRTVFHITVNSYNVKNDGVVVVNIAIDDDFGRVYHEIEFEKISDDWIVSEFGVDI